MTDERLEELDYWYHREICACPMNSAVHQDYADILELIHEEQSRRAVQPKEVQRAIENFKSANDNAVWIDSAYIETPIKCKDIIIAITALQAYSEPKQVPSEDVKEAISYIEGGYGDVVFWSSSRRQAILQALRQMQGWIPCSDRLPKVYQHENGEPMEFNVMVEGAEVPKTLCFNGDRWFPWDKWEDTYNVTHWMPLPEPPKEET